MAVQIVMSQFGPEMTEGRIVHWLKSEGDAVSKGETLLEIESEKAVVEIEASADGVLGPILKGDGSIAVVGEVLSHIFSQDEMVSQANRPAEPVFTAVSVVETDPVNLESQLRSDGKRKSSPLARRLAQELHIDLAGVQGSGPGGRITQADIRRAALLPSGSASPATKVLDFKEPAVASVATMPLEHKAKIADLSPKFEEIPFNGTRAVIASRMHESHQVTAPVTLTTEACATALVALRQELNLELSTQLGFSIGYNELMIKIVACTLNTMRFMNARLESGAIRVSERINIGLAVDTPRGLVVPVIRDANTKGVAEIGVELRGLIVKALKAEATPEDLSGGTFTITNLGMFEIDAFTPIINLPQTAILGIGQIKPRPVVVDNQICIQQMVWLSLTFDHRLVDGAPAARFLQYIKKFIEKPGLIIA